MNVVVSRVSGLIELIHSEQLPVKIGSKALKIGLAGCAVGFTALGTAFLFKASVTFAVPLAVLVVGVGLVAWRFFNHSKQSKESLQSGLLSLPDQSALPSLPDDVWVDQILPYVPFPLREMGWVSKQMKICSDKTIRKLVEERFCSLQIIGRAVRLFGEMHGYLVNTDEVVKFVIQNGLKAANLLYFGDLRNVHLERLAENCPQLECLFLHSNVIDLIPRFENLKALHLKKCRQLQDASLVHLASFTRLETLDLGGCFLLKDAALENVARLTCLQALGLSKWEQLTDAGLAYLTGLTRLQTLDLGDCQLLTDAALENVARLTCLQVLGLSKWEKLTDAGLAHLTGLTRLQKLDFSECRTGLGIGLPHLAGLTCLQTHGDRLTIDTLRTLTPDEHVREVNLLQFERPEASFVHLASFTRLQTLDIGGCFLLTDATLKNIAGLTCLQLLQLRESLLTGAGFVHLTGLTRLKELDLGGCWALKDVAFENVARLTCLKTLHLGKSLITDANLAHLTGLTHLQGINLSECEKLTDAGIVHLTGLKSLQILNLRKCKGLTDVGIAHLSGITSLQRLGISLFENIGNLQATLPFVTIECEELSLANLLN